MINPNFHLNIELLIHCMSLVDIFLRKKHNNYTVYVDNKFAASL